MDSIGAFDLSIRATRPNPRYFLRWKETVMVPLATLFYLRLNLLKISIFGAPRIDCLHALKEGKTVLPNVTNSH